EAVGQPEQRRTEYDYDANGNLTVQRSGLAPNSSIAGYQKQVTTRYGYDALNRKTGVTEAAGTEEERRGALSYDAADNLVLVITGMSSLAVYAHAVVTQYGY